MKEGPNCIEATCANENCKIVLPSIIWKTVLDYQEGKRYDDFLFKSFVEISKRAKWCPGRDCKRVCELKDNVSINQGT